MPGDYRLDDLGWYQFERLIQALLRAAYGASLEAWGGGSDFGRDAYAPGALSFPDREVEAQGPFIFQAKFVSGANAAGARPYPSVLKAVRAEVVRINERREAGTWQNPNYYTLLTNAPLSGTERNELREEIKVALPDAQVVLHGATDVAAGLDAAPEIRQSYPQVLGLRDLRALIAEIVTADVTNRSSIAIDQVARLAQVFVPTGAYNETLAVLERHGFAVLTGPPEMGKTATAWMVALTRLTMGWEVYDCRGPNDLFRMHEKTKNQLFVADDAFGSTEYRPDIANEWAADLGRILHIAGQNHWVIWTSRPGPLKTGLERLNLQSAAPSFPTPMQIQVDTSTLSVAEKAQILYRHAKSTNLPEGATSILKNYSARIVESPHFTPMRIERLVTNQLPNVMTSNISNSDDLLRAVIAEGLQQPSSAMRTSFNTLHHDTQDLLIAMLNGSNQPMTLQQLDLIRTELLDGAPAESTELTATLIDDHFIRMRPMGNDTAGETSTVVVDWVHPSVRDTVIEYLMDHDMDRRRFLRTARAAGVLTALATAGGAAGTRSRPLLRSPGDWRALEASVKAISRRNDEAEHLTLLQALDEALKAARGSAAVQKVLGMVSEALSGLLVTWQREMHPISNAALGLFYDLSVRASVLVASPPLEPTWEAATRAVDAATADELGYEGLEQVNRWVDLASILRSNEPRFLRMREYKDDLESRVYNLISWVRTWSNGLDDLGGADEQAEADELSVMSWRVASPALDEYDETYIIENVVRLVEQALSISSRNQRAGRRVADTLHGHYQARMDRRQRREGLETDQGEERLTLAPREEGSGDFDIVEFFDDL